MALEDKAPLFPNPKPHGFLQEAIKAVPAVRYALGIGGIIAVIAIVSSFGIGFRVALFGTVVMLVLMTVLVIFAKLAGQASSSFQAPALVFTWFSLILFMAVSVVLFTSVFWGIPVDLRNLLGVSVPETKPVMLPASGPMNETPPKTSGTQPAASTIESPPKPSGPQSSATLSPASPAQETPKTSPKNDAATATTVQAQEDLLEPQAHGLEVRGDDEAERAISFVYCGLSGCNNKGPNQADLDEGRRLWASAISKWTRAMNMTQNHTYYDRLREKTRPENGVSCDDHSCEPNFTHENREFGIHIPASQFDPQ